MLRRGCWAIESIDESSIYRSYVEVLDGTLCASLPEGARVVSVGKCKDDTGRYNKRNPTFGVKVFGLERIRGGVFDSWSDVPHSARRLSVVFRSRDKEEVALVAAAYASLNELGLQDSLYHGALVDSRRVRCF
jgi:hypothetical protein